MKNVSRLASTAGGVLPLLLIGTGTGLILMNRRKNGMYRSGQRWSGSEPKRSGNGKDPAAAANAGGGSAIGNVTDAAATAYHKVEEAVSSTASKVADVASAGKDKYVNYLDRNPMAVGAVAAALGLAVGLALPLTDAETELLGETAGSLRDSLKETAKRTVGNIQESAAGFLDSVQRAASEPPAAPSS